MITLDEYIEVLKGVLLAMHGDRESEEAVHARELLVREVSEMDSAGVLPSIPFDYAGGGADAAQ